MCRRSGTAVGEREFRASVLLVIFVGRRIRNSGGFFAFGDKTEAGFVDAQSAEVTSGAFRATLAKLKVVFDRTALITVTCDDDLFARHLLQARDVSFQALTSVGANPGAVEVEVDRACLAGVSLARSTAADKALLAGLVAGTTGLTSGVAGTGVLADFVRSGAVRVAGTSGLFRDTLVVFADLAAVSVAVGVAVVLADPLTLQRGGVAALSGIGALYIVACFVDTLVAVAFLLRAAIFSSAAFQALPVDAEKVFLGAVAFFVGGAVFVAVTLGPRFGAPCEGRAEDDEHHNQPEAM